MVRLFLSLLVLIPLLKVNRITPAHASLQNLCNCLIMLITDFDWQHLIRDIRGTNIWTPVLIQNQEIYPQIA